MLLLCRYAHPCIHRSRAKLQGFHEDLSLGSDHLAAAEVALLPLRHQHLQSAHAVVAMVSPPAVGRREREIVTAAPNAKAKAMAKKILKMGAMSIMVAMKLAMTIAAPGAMVTATARSARAHPAMTPARRTAGLARRAARARGWPPPRRGCSAPAPRPAAPSHRCTRRIACKGFSRRTLSSRCCCCCCWSCCCWGWARGRQSEGLQYQSRENHHYSIIIWSPYFSLSSWLGPTDINKWIKEEDGVYSEKDRSESERLENGEW